MGPDDISQPLSATTDVGVYDASTGDELTSGELYWSDGQAGARTINVLIQPFSPGVWHVEKRYYVNVCSVRSNSSSSVTNAGQISPTASTVTIIVCTDVSLSLLLCIMRVTFFQRFTVRFLSSVNQFQGSECCASLCYG